MPGAAPKGYTGGLNLGGASFQLGMDVSPLKKGMADTKKDVFAFVNETQRGFKTASDTITKSSRGAAQGLLALGQAVDDVQYGFRSIVNNIPQIVYMMGGGAGIAGAVGIAAVAINQLINHWGTLTNAFQAAWSGSTLDQLEQVRLKAEAATEAFEKLAKTPSKAQKAAAEGISGLITEGPVEKILKDTIDAVTADALLGTKPKIPEMGAMKKGIGAMLGLIPAEDIPEKRKALEEKAKKDAEAANIDTAKKLLGAAASGDKNAMLSLGALVKRHPGAFPPEFMQDVMNMTPEGQKRLAQEGLERQGMRSARKIDQDFAEKERQKQIDQNNLEIEGRKNVQRFEKERQSKEEATAKKLSQGFVGLGLLRGGGIKAGEVERVMKLGGIDTRKGGQRPEEVRKQIIKDLRQEIKDEMAATGATERQATAIVRSRHEQDLMGNQRRPQTQAEFVGITEFAKKIQLGALNKDDQIQKQQLTALERIRVAIINAAARGQAPGLAAGPG